MKIFKRTGDLLIALFGVETKPGSFNGLMLMIIPIFLIIDVVLLPYDIYRWIHPKKIPEVKK